MAKKRKTRQEKIILQLKRELAKNQPQNIPVITESEPRQEAIINETKHKSEKTVTEKKLDSSIYFYDPRLVRKDLFKTALLTLVVISLEIVLYLRLR